MTNSRLKNLLVDLESMLVNSESRKSGEVLNDLLHDEFLEVGSSGRQYNKQQTIQLLNKESRSPMKARNFRFHRISDSVVLLTYTLEENTPDSIAHQSIRSSIWKIENEKWNLIFHQGTPVKPG